MTFADVGPTLAEATPQCADQSIRCHAPPVRPLEFRRSLPLAAEERDEVGADEVLHVCGRAARLGGAAVAVGRWSQAVGKRQSRGAMRSFPTEV